MEFMREAPVGDTSPGWLHSSLVLAYTHCTCAFTRPHSVHTLGWLEGPLPYFANSFFLLKGKQKHGTFLKKSSDPVTHAFFFSICHRVVDTCTVFFPHSGHSPTSQQHSTWVQHQGTPETTFTFHLGGFSWPSRCNILGISS